MRVFLFLLCLLPFVVGPSASAQTDSLAAADQARLDALIGAPDVDGLRAWQREGDAPDDVGALLERVDARTEAGSAAVKTYVLQQVRVGASYTEALAGPTAVRLYQRFLELAEAEDYDEALVYIEASRYFLVRHTRSVTAILDAAQQNVFDLLQDGQYVAARSALNAVEQYMGSRHPDHRPFIDRLSTQRVIADARLEDGERRVSRYERNEPAIRRAGGSVKLGVATRSAPGSVSLASAGGNLDFDGFEGGVTLSVNPEGFVFLTPRIALGLGGELTRATFENRGSSDPFQLDIPMETTSIYGMARYMLRTTVGVRPYLQAGVGQLRSRRRRASGTYISRTTGGPLPFTIPERSEVGIQVRAALGLDYVTCASCPISLGGEFAVLRNSTDDALVSPWQSGFGFRAAYSF